VKGNANVNSDVKINLMGGDHKVKTEEACRRSGTCLPELLVPKPLGPSPPLTTKSTEGSTSQVSSSTAAGALQALQELVARNNLQNGQDKDSATVMINGIPVKIPLGK